MGYMTPCKELARVRSPSPGAKSPIDGAEMAQTAGGFTNSYARVGTPLNLCGCRSCGLESAWFVVKGSGAVGLARGSKGGS